MPEAVREKMTPKRALSLTARGLKIIRKVFPRYLTFAAVRSALEAARPLIILYFSARILDELSVRAGAIDLRAVAVYAALAVGLTFLISVLSAVLSKRTSVMGSEWWYRMNQFRGERYAGLDYEYVEQSRVNEMLAGIAARENSNGLGFANLLWHVPEISGQLIGLAGSAVLLIGMFRAPSKAGGSFFASPWSSVLLAALIALMLSARVFLTKVNTKLLKSAFEAIPKSNMLYGYYNDYIEAGSAAKELRLYRQQDRISEILGRSGWSWLKPMIHISGMTDGLTGAAGAVISGCVYLTIGLRALSGMYGIGQVTQYVGAITSLAETLSSLINTLAVLRENAEFLPPLFEYLDLPDVKHKGSLTTEKRADNDYEIEFRNVSFRYPGCETCALRNLSLSFRVGERLAVVGMNGSGKTTMIKLLCRLYDPTEGVITLNGIDIRKYDYEEYMGVFSVVFQDFKLLAFPLAQNVAASVNYDPEFVRSALREVGFEIREKTMKNGLDTPLYKDYNENGVMISGGEAQKLALARAIYRDAPFIVLDEPTAALDPIAEYEIYSKFDEIVGNKTAIYISHRLSSCRFCDDIAVFHEGRLIQRGSHEELLRDQQGKYYELWNAQAQYYRPSGT